MMVFYYHSGAYFISKCTFLSSRESFFQMEIYYQALFRS